MKKREVSLKTRMVLLVGALVLFQAVLIGVALLKSTALLHALEQATGQELPATKNLILGDMMHDSLRALVLGSLHAEATNDRTALESYQKEALENGNKFLKYFNNLESLGLSSTSMQTLTNLKKDITAYADLCNSVIESLIKGDKVKSKNEVLKFNEKFKYLEEALGEFGDHVEKESMFNGYQGKDIVFSLTLMSIIGAILSLVSGFIIFRWTRKSFDVILLKMSSVSNVIWQSSQSVLDESTTVKDSTMAQAASIQESVSALSEMSSMIAQTGKNVRVSNDTTLASQERAMDGKKIMGHLKQSMGSIQTANNSLQEITGVIDNIVNKTAVINDIVFKTQLLSFNASIEAARAGAHGRGFAVVAEEVGNLAELSGAAAKEIESLLGDSQRRVKETLEVIKDRVADGNRVSQNAYEVFEDISRNIDEIGQQVKGINEATQQQEIGIQQTNLAMKQMDTSSQTNSVAASRAQQYANQLLRDGQSLKQMVSDVTELINGFNDNPPMVSRTEAMMDPIINRRDEFQITRKSNTESTENLNDLVDQVIESGSRENYKEGSIKLYPLNKSS